MSLKSLWIGALTAVAVFGAVTTAKSAIINLAVGGTAVINSGADLVFADNQRFVAGAFSDMFTFTNNTGDDTFLNFVINTTQVGGDPIGLANLEFSFDNGDTFSGLTDANGVLNPAPFLLTTAFGTASDLVLTVSYSTISTIPGNEAGSYDFNASVVPLPPALLLFGTALGGMGWLSRRRKESATA